MSNHARRGRRIDLVDAGHIPKKPRFGAVGGRAGREARQKALMILRRERGWKLEGAPPKRLGPGKPIR